MKTPDWKDETITTSNGFLITLRFEDEHMNAKDHFCNECGWEIDEYKKIADYYWFSVNVIATKDGYTVGSAYLGGNCYKNKKEVLGTSIETCLAGYMPQLIDEAIEDCIAIKKPKTLY